MKTIWIDNVTGAEYDNYDEACDAVLQYLDTDDCRDALEEVISEYGVSELLKGLIRPNIGAHLYQEIMDTAERIVLSKFLVEDEVEEVEETPKDE